MRSVLYNVPTQLPEHPAPLKTPACPAQSPPNKLKSAHWHASYDDGMRTESQVNDNVVRIEVGSNVTVGVREIGSRRALRTSLGFALRSQ